MIELLVTIAIFGVITTMTTANFRQGSRNDELRIASQLVGSEFRRAQTMTIGGKAMFVCLAGPKVGQFCPTGSNAQCGNKGICRNTVPDGGYGIHLDTAAGRNQRVKLFADANGDGKMQSVELLRDVGVSPNTNVVISAVSPTMETLDFTFRPPDALGLVNGDPDGSVIATVYVRHPDVETPRRVVINAMSGQISAD